MMSATFQPVGTRVGVTRTLAGPLQGSAAARPAVRGASIVAHAAPGPGADNKSLSTRLATGVALAAVPVLAALPAFAADGDPSAATRLLCNTPGGVDVVGITETIALIGAIVGGVAAKSRKDELERVNDQLRRINLQMRRQARTEQYAPGLQYAPKPAVESPVSPALGHLKTGKRALRDEDGATALAEFDKAAKLLEGTGDLDLKRKCVRGQGAALERLNRAAEAVQRYKEVLSLSQQLKNTTGDVDAIGSIADCYTAMGDMEEAAKYYDLYISKMEDDDMDVLSSIDDQRVGSW